jgi:hypothetical protein
MAESFRRILADIEFFDLAVDVPSAAGAEVPDDTRGGTKGTKSWVGDGDTSRFLT